MAAGWAGVLAARVAGSGGGSGSEVAWRLLRGRRHGVMRGGPDGDVHTASGPRVVACVGMCSRTLAEKV